VLSPFLYSLFTHNCVATHDSKTIKFAEDTVVVDLIIDDETEIGRSESWQRGARTTTCPSVSARHRSW
jgi:hypothetical protein